MSPNPYNTESLLQDTRVLIVDDQPTNLQALYHALQAEHTVLAATRGSAALHIAQDKKPDIILLDVVMPEMDGHEVCRRLKADPATRDIPVIFVTGQTDPDAETTGLGLGAVDFITKPFNPNVVRARVRTHLMLKRQADLLRGWVYIDGLTGAYNRRHFDERLRAEWGRCQRMGSPLSVLMIDVDHFKHFNDAFGHAHGDLCLRTVARTLGGSLQRSTDQLFRYGGEEFVCLLPNTDQEGAFVVGEHLRRQVESLSLEPPTGDQPLRVTVSIGVGVMRPPTMADASAMVREADRNLYQAKTQGRNRVMAGPADE
ncbi:MAG: hypothetical protein RL758_1342 [Pseudomonadota bacterium]|jgi:diguanylate cyclase (GGDEF)-like protein